MINIKHIGRENTHKKYFLKASPFPHVVIDDFLDKKYYSMLLAELENYYEENKKTGKYYNTEVEPDKWSSQGTELSTDLKSLGDFLKSEKLIEFLQKITGLENLDSTEYNSQLGFFHYMKKNSYLTPHIDHMQEMGENKALRYHVLNIIIYVSKKWDPNWGGGTILKHRKTGNFSGIDFVPNRALIFLHSPISIHGVNKVSQYSDEKRFSIYFDYYTKNRFPYEHLDEKIKVEKSPHLFFLNNKLKYLKLSNRKYLKDFISYYKNKLFNN